MLLTHPKNEEVILRDFVRLAWGEGAEDIYLAFEKGIRQMDEEDREIWIRASEIAVRNATKVAFFRGSRTVDVQDMNWAMNVATESTKQLQLGYREYSKDDLDQADIVRRLRDRFKREGRLTAGQVSRLCERYVKDYRKIDAAIEHLKRTSEIAEEQPEEKKDLRGRPSTAWIYIRKKPPWM